MHIHCFYNLKRKIEFRKSYDSYRILEFSAAVNVAIGEPNLKFLIATVKQLMKANQLKSQDVDFFYSQFRIFDICFIGREILSILN